MIDTGVRATHTEFGGRVAGGWDFVDADADASSCDSPGHGTHVAGILGGTTYGVAKQVGIVPLRVLDCDAEGYARDVIAALDWAVAHRPAGPAVINLSLSGGPSSTLDTAVTRTVAAGIPVVVAAGNADADACAASPGRAPAAITVAASDAADRRTWYSNYGRCVDLFAPGDRIASAVAASDTAVGTLSGTSMAAPAVAGLVARLREAGPDLTTGQVGCALVAAATPGRIGDAAGSPNLLAHAAASELRPPCAPTGVSVRRSDRAASATISWAPPANPGTSPVTAYTITRDGTDNRLRGPLTLTVPASRRSVTLTELRGRRTYHLAVRAVSAVSAVGAGAVSRASVTMGTVPLSAPTSVRVSRRSYAKRTARLTWAAPTDSGGKTITAYRVYRSGENTRGQGPYAKTLSRKARSLTFTKLKRDTTYTLQVRARTGKTYGPKTTVTVRLTR